MDCSRPGCRASIIEHIRNTEIRRQMDRFERASGKMKKKIGMDTYGGKIATKNILMGFAKKNKKRTSRRNLDTTVQQDMRGRNSFKRRK